MIYLNPECVCGYQCNINNCIYQKFDHVMFVIDAGACARPCHNLHTNRPRYYSIALDQYIYCINIYSQSFICAGACTRPCHNLHTNRPRYYSIALYQYIYIVLIFIHSLLSALARVLDPVITYIPTDQDIIRLHWTSVGITESLVHVKLTPDAKPVDAVPVVQGFYIIYDLFTSVSQIYWFVFVSCSGEHVGPPLPPKILDFRMRLWDVGGFLLERAKWSSYYERRISALVYVVSLDGYKW